MTSPFANIASMASQIRQSERPPPDPLAPELKIADPTSNSDIKTNEASHEVMTKPTTGRRAEALRDLALGGVSLAADLIGKPLAALIAKIVSVATKILGAEGFTPKETAKPEEIEAHQKDSTDRLDGIKTAHSFGEAKQSMEGYRANGTLPQDSKGYQPYAQHTAIHIATGLDALEKVYGEDAAACFETHISPKLQELLAKEPSAKTSKEIKGLFLAGVKAYENSVPTGDPKKEKGFDVKAKVATFTTEMDKARGKRIPVELTRTFTADGETFTETATNAKTKASGAFLTLVGKDKAYTDEINYNHNSNSSPDGPSRRLSPLKAQKEVQGTPINLCNHKLADHFGSTSSVARGGIPATHGRGKPGLAELQSVRAKISSLINTSGPAEPKDQKNLEEALELLEMVDKSLEKASGIAKESSEEKLERLEDEISTREHLIVAQFLPKIAIQVQNQIANNRQALAASTDSGYFLCVEETFVSDQNAGEKAMLEDASGAIPYINENILIRLSNDPKEDQKVEPHKDANGKEVPDKFVLTVCVPREQVDTAALRREPFGTRQILVAHGVNEFQSMGHLMTPDAEETYQDKINKAGIEQLFKIAEERGKENTQAISALREHFSSEGTRAGKDIRGVNLIADAVAALGGARGISCKSGKDRTGTEASNALARAISPVDPDPPKKITEALMGGISFEITGQNTGKQNAFAFNSFQLPTLPEDWRPPAEYCGNVES